jgi:hypothetical protein
MAILTEDMKRVVREQRLCPTPRVGLGLTDPEYSARNEPPLSSKAILCNACLWELHSAPHLSRWLPDSEEGRQRRTHMAREEGLQALGERRDGQYILKLSGKIDLSTVRSSRGSSGTQARRSPPTSPIGRP